MNNRRKMVIAAAGAIAVALPLLAAERLAVKTGLWENTVTMHVTGVTLPTEQLEKMPAAQRAQVEALMRQMGVGAPRTQTDESCIKEEDLDGRTFRQSMEEAGESCEVKEVASTSRRQEYTFQCSDSGVSTSGRMVIDVVDDSRVRGTMEAALPQGRMDMKFEASWKAAACGNVE
jgi:hypothetical protein